MNPLGTVDYEISKIIIEKDYSVLDLGANIGLTALYYLEAGAARVTAIEPNIENYQRLKSINDARLISINKAVSDVAGEVELYISSTHNQGHSINPIWELEFPNVFTSGQKVNVQCDTLDNLFKNEIFDFIKIDVEGAENKVLKGGEAFFERHKNSIIQIEIYDKYFNEVNTHLKSIFINVIACARTRKMRFICIILIKKYLRI